MAIEPDTVLSRHINFLKSKIMEINEVPANSGGITYSFKLRIAIFAFLIANLIYKYNKKRQRDDCEYFQKNCLAKTYEVKLLGRVGIYTTDPVNVQAIIEGPVDTLLAELKSSARGIVDLQHFFFKFTLNTTTSLIFGEPFVGLDPAENEQFQTDFNYSGLITAIRVHLTEWHWLYNPSNYKKSCSIGKRYAMQYVDHALKDMNQNGTEEASKRHHFIIDLYQELRDPVLTLRSSPQGFALREASYGIIRILQTFPNIRLPSNCEILTPGREKQALTLVLRSGKVVMLFWK
ncbi:hypothetical protein SS1G_01179 [Sclerotinia sclerotiorum 1980 UF-70]|uniref:Cytochrome P450 n=1 Tax=Sclerotinia sclerotiorum (strain ATCC 18683 / 1980 / Ss-1) TaxID=665079 RepID=A7E7A2_SCLS1|nr:hypothetical protein SS1G_01179 [Sclerotinia sclerotiorum 1980 UF-70]EDN96254.1 hypothetical protein SS1G_01179 [Sclerotinia sclerotiorum 1980 UF-70]